MSDVKHTPGPWEWCGEARANTTFDREGDVLPPTSTQTGGYQYAGPIAVVSINNDAGGEANGRLIAAAPELLAACEAHLATIDGMPAVSLEDGSPCVMYSLDTGDALAMMRAAVAKARGQ